MNKRAFLGFAITILTVCAAVIVFLAAGLWGRFFDSRDQQPRRTRIIIPRETGGSGDSAAAEQMAWEDSLNTKLALEDGEIVVSVLTQDFDADPAEEQIVAYRNLLEIESPVYITYIKYDEKSREYKRLWSISTAATRPGTISLYTQDLIGDRNSCVILTGMNSQGEHTMTIFRRNPQVPATTPFVKITELRIDGSITVQESERSQAYQQGIARDKSFTIAAYSHDSASVNILDQLETTYAFNPAKGLYEQSKVTRIPGSQIEQRKLRELLSGAPGVFESFINELWYYVSPQGTLDNRQYIYFDPAAREIIFFGDETQQIFNWQHSTPTRYGLYISSQNISITTLRRFLDIELESLDSIRLRVFEDVRLKIAVSASWDGSYRRAGAQLARQSEPSIKPNIDALYDSAWGRLHFYPSGEYDLSSGGLVRKGHYVFFRVNGQELLELRPETGETHNALKSDAPKSDASRGDAPRNARNDNADDSRMVYRVDAAHNAGAANVSLSRVRLGATGIQDLHEGVVVLTRAEG
ncbi:hypothetical protein AGMMS50293_22340 [Spirochaetia bacterium]|nr:hypothetical protein AGMMS50293_22340 [Spirochaetia bacterium]